MRIEAEATERYLRLTLLSLFAITAARLVWLRVGGLDLYPDEAQYWLWSLTPDWGYYSKPPLIAWVIHLTTSLLGDDEAAIRVAAPLFHFGTALVIYQIAHRLYDARVAAWSAVAYATLPGVSLSAMIMSTDVPLLFCWAVALYAFVRAREAGGGRWWLAVGLAGGIGLLSKYAMAYWLLSALLFLVVVRDERRHLRRFLAAAALALLIYAPNFVWNLNHQFVSYRHTEANANIVGLALHPRAFAEFLSSQFLVFGPILFAALLVVVTLLRRVLADRRAQLLTVFALPTLAMVVVVSLLSRAQPNWAAPTYVSAVVLVAAFLLERGRAALVASSVAFHVMTWVLILGARDAAHFVDWDIPGKIEPLQRLRGWAVLGKSVTTLLRAHPGLRLVSDDRETLAALVYYVRPHPFDALKWNPSGQVHDQFDMTANLGVHPGVDVLFLASRNDSSTLEKYFSETVGVGHIAIGLGGGASRDYTWAALKGFKGYCNVRSEPPRIDDCYIGPRCSSLDHDRKAVKPAAYECLKMAPKGRVVRFNQCLLIADERTRRGHPPTAAFDPFWTCCPSGVRASPRLPRLVPAFRPRKRCRFHARRPAPRSPAAVPAAPAARPT